MPIRRVPPRECLRLHRDLQEVLGTFSMQSKRFPAPPLEPVEPRRFMPKGRMAALALWLPHRMAPAMTQLPAILIVLTLTGEPVANALCIAWCDQPSERQHCSDVIAQPTSRALSVAGSTCEALLTASPFLREEARSGDPAIAPATGPAVDCGLTETGLARLRATGDATCGRPVPVLVLRV